MEFIDLSAQQQRIRTNLDAKISAVLDHGQYILGPEVRELESRLASYVGVKHSIACASGTDALLMALMAHCVGPGDAILTSPFTFIATAEVITLLGATPVFVDIDPRTYNLNPEDLDRAIRAIQKDDRKDYPLPHSRSLRPRGIIGVDLFGLPADYDRISEISKRHGLFVVEDAAQSFGAEYNGKKSCSLGHIACTSFFPAKPLGCYGDGGMCFTDDDQLAETMKSIRVHGKGNHKYDNVRIGINGRLDTLQAAILLTKFDIFPEEIELRQQVAKRYDEGLSSASSLLLPYTPPNSQSSWAQYSILAGKKAERDALQARLKENQIPTAVYYPKPLHLQTAFNSLGYKEGDLPISEDCALRIFSLPMHPYLTAEDQKKIADVLVQ